MNVDRSNKTGIWQKAFLDRDEDGIADFWIEHEMRMKAIIRKYISYCIAVFFFYLHP